MSSALAGRTNAVVLSEGLDVGSSEGVPLTHLFCAAPIRLVVWATGRRTMSGYIVASRAWFEGRENTPERYEADLRQHAIGFPVEWFIEVAEQLAVSIMKCLYYHKHHSDKLGSRCAAISIYAENLTVCNAEGLPFSLIPQIFLKNQDKNRLGADWLRENKMCQTLITDLWNRKHP